MEGTSGNLSVRPGVAGPTISISASGREKGSLTPRDVVEVEVETGRALPGDGRPSAETAIHLALYTAFPDCHAVVHAHPPYATAVSVRAARAGLESVGFEEYEIIKGFGLSGEPRVSIPIFHNHRDVARIAAEVREYYEARRGWPETPDTFLISHHGATAGAAT
jgi:methylthioribose-1-phosphate isomerase/methylthioribulose-1-phosphate dehydratase